MKLNILQSEKNGCEEMEERRHEPIVVSVTLNDFSNFQFRIDFCFISFDFFKHGLE